MSGPKGKAQKKAAKKAAKQKKKGAPRKTNHPKKNNSGPMMAPPKNVASSVTDGVNVGMVWKNSNQVRDHFNRRFEKVMDIPVASTAFALIQNFFLNPGNSLLFPVFSQIASTYEEYICHLLRFWYRGEEYMASGTLTSAGIIAMATNMDPDDATFTNVTQLENYEGSVSGPPFAGHFVHDVSIAHKSRGRNRSKGDALALNQYFVFSSANIAAPTGQAAKFYDMGQFQLVSNGAQAATPAGELWVEHEWTLIRRKQETPIGQQVLYAHVIEGPLASAAAAASKFLGTTGGTLVTGSTIPVVSTASTFTLPIAGTFVLTFSTVGSTTVVATFTPGGNITATPTILVDSSAAAANAVAAGTSVQVAVFTVSANGTGAANTITITGLTSLAAGKVDIFITQISGGALLALKSKDTQKEAFAALCERFDELEKKLARSQTLSLTAVSEPDTPCEEIKETDGLDSSVHISKSTAEQLLRGLGLRK